MQIPATLFAVFGPSWAATVLLSGMSSLPRVAVFLVLFLVKVGCDATQRNVELDSTAAEDPLNLRRRQPANAPGAAVLTNDQIKAFRRDGFLVVPILTPEEVAEARQGLHATLARHGIDHTRWNTSAAQLRPLQLTGGKGGIVDIYVDEWAMRLRTHPRMFAAISQLWGATWANGGTEDFTAPQTSSFKFNSSAGGYAYIDRAVWRLPIPGAGAPGSAQPGLLPHFDQCPLDLYGVRGLVAPPERWRPIQSSISLRCALSQA